MNARIKGPPQHDKNGAWPSSPPPTKIGGVKFQSIVSDMHRLLAITSSLLTPTKLVEFSDQICLDFRLVDLKSLRPWKNATVDRSLLG